MNTKFKPKSNGSISLLSQPWEHYKSKNYMKAYQSIRQKIKFYGENAEAHYLAGLIETALELHTQAQSQFLLALQLQPNHEQSALELAISFFNEERIQEAESLLMKCRLINKMEDNQNVWLYLGLIDEKMQRYRLAQQNLLKCLQLSKNKNSKCKKALARVDKKLFCASNTQLQKQSLDLQIKDLEKKCSQKQKQGYCLICHKKQSTYANKNCGHLSTCEQCVFKIQRICPHCAKEGDFIRIYTC